MPIEFAMLLIAALVFLFAARRAIGPKGKRGERRVSSGLSRFLDTSVYRIIDDVTLPTRSGTTQIDHLVVSPYGVFVIETKNLAGWIFGGEHQQNWTQVLYRRKSRFFSPIRQNRHHLNTVQSLFRLNPNQTQGYVVFTGEGIFKTDMPSNVVSGVRNLSELMQSRTQRVLSDQDVARVIREIAAQRLKPGRETERAHLRHVEERVRKRDAGCPHCGGPMDQRTNRTTGETFLGCNQYPRCRGTRPLP